MKSFLLTLAVLLCCGALFAQKSVSGTITDAEGVALIGVNVVVQGTARGSISDLDGRYELQNVAESDTLVFSYLGYATQKRPVGTNSSIDLQLSDNATVLEELVVIGYESVRREEITSSIVSVDGSELTTFSASNPAEALQGRASGVQVVSSGGAPGASPQIVIRGVTSNLGTAPLIVLDGVPLPPGTSLNLINSNDIEDFQILKDASATAIYGSRASNGAILVTTKRGKEGKTNISAEVSYGLQNLNIIDVADRSEYIAVQNQLRTNDGQPAAFEDSDDLPDTDWLGEILNDNAPMIDASINVTGGNERLRTASSVSYFRQNSNYDKGWYERMTARLNLDYKISDKVTLRQDINPRLENWENTPNPVWGAMRIDPLTDVLIPEADREGLNEFSIYRFGGNGAANPVANIARQFNENQFFGLLTNTQLGYEPIEGLKFNSQFAFNWSNSNSNSFNPTYFETGFFQRPINNVSRTDRTNFDYVWNNTVSFKRTFNDIHSINLLGGVTLDYQRDGYLSSFREDIPSDTDVNLRYLDAAVGERMSVGGVEATQTIYSLIGRAMYNYDFRYYLTGTIRRDASSRFAEDNRVGVFPSISAAWDLDSEAFFNVPWVTDLRIRAGYGEVGNQNIARDAQFFAIGQADHVFGGQRVVTNFLSQFGNPGLRWETVKDYNLSLSGALLANRLNFSVERYRKESSDLLFYVELPNYTGIPTRVAQNVGSFVSTGWDVALGYNGTAGELTYSIDVTASTNESIADELAPGNEELFGQRREDLGNRFLKITEVGGIVGSFYGFQTDGLFQDQFEINAHSNEEGRIIQPNAQPGDVRFVDQNQDGVINDEDLTVLGSPFPDFYGGVNLNFGYRNFDLNMQWYATVGNDVLNYGRTFYYNGQRDVNVRAGTLDNVWTPDNRDAEFPRLSFFDRNGNYNKPSDLFIEDASYLRLRTVQLGYNLGIGGGQKLRLFVTGQNLLTFTDYSGFDPEVSANGSIIDGYGIDYARIPVSRTVLFGLNLNL